MIVRLRFIGQPSRFLKKDKVYYCRLTQRQDLSIFLLQLPERKNAISYKNLEAFLRDFRILSIDKGVRRELA